MPSTVDLIKDLWVFTDTMDGPIIFVLIKGYAVKLPTKYLGPQHLSKNFLFLIFDALRLTSYHCSMRLLSSNGRKYQKYG